MNVPINMAVQVNTIEGSCRRRDLQPECDRPIVHQADFHIRSEYAAGAWVCFLSGLLYQVVKQTLSFLRRRSWCETWPVTTVGISCQRELGHEQQSAIGLAQIEIHPACIVRKNSVGQYSLQQSVRLGAPVITLHSNQGEDSFFDAACDFSVHMNRSFGYSL